MAVHLSRSRMPARHGRHRVASRGTGRGVCMPVVVADAVPHVGGLSRVTKVLVRRDDEAGPLIVFVAATLVMVLVVAVVGAVGQWWVLVPAMLTDLILTFLVIAGIAGLLADDGESTPPGASR